MIIATWSRGYSAVIADIASSAEGGCCPSLQSLPASRTIASILWCRTELSTAQ